MEDGDGSHVKETNVLTEHATVEPPAVHPVAQDTVHDSESAMLIPAAAAAVSLRSTHKAKEHGDGPRANDANVLNEHVAEELLAPRPVAHLTGHVSGSAVPITAATIDVSMRSTHTKGGARGWIALVGCQRSEGACRRGAAGRASCGALHGALL